MSIAMPRVASRPSNGSPIETLAPVRVDGKFFSRGGERLRLNGVTYGPFPPDERGDPFGSVGQVRRDFERMQAHGVNAVRTYHVPTEWFLDEADAAGMLVFSGVNWSDHFTFLDSRAMQREARERAAEVARLGRDHPSLFAYCIGNEIRPDIVRWHGAPRVERFLGELADVVRQHDPAGLVTYSNYPSTEYLDLAFVDFHTFNVYLEDDAAFERYFLRLQSVADTKPLILGELGLDTMRNGEDAQADRLGRQLRLASLMGGAGAFVFAWTDEWYTGGHLIEDWAFGLTTAEREPKPALDAVAEVYQADPADLLAETPRVSVVVCSYNGGATLDQCLTSLGSLRYPDYEVVLVDDGSTDDTREIVARHPWVRAIHQENKGLSAARNVGAAAATGEVVAYTDSDCYADADWLALLVAALRRSDAAAVGGPNLSPEDGRVPALVASSPGQPTHVLETDVIAEHVPGCNMAFYAWALDEIGGFDPVYRKAGDDVDVCWRLQQAGYWITFAPGAFVWHHRRQTPRAYLRQQAGYGEAEALLALQYPERFTGRGEGRWQGVVYGVGSRGLRLRRPFVYTGLFGAGLFQRVYESPTPGWAYLPATLEWAAATVAAAVLGFAWAPLWGLAAVLLLGSVAVAVAQAVQTRVPHAHDGPAARAAIAGLAFLQPLVRYGKRSRTRFETLRKAPG